MDYRALAELVMLGLLGLSTFVVAVGFSVRLFIAPTLRELFGRRTSPAQDSALLAERLTRIEDRLESLDANVDRLADAQEFDRRLEGPKAG